MNNPILSVCVIGYHGNKDIWPLTETFFEKNFTKDPSIEFLFVSDEIIFESKFFDTSYVESSSFGDRLVNVISKAKSDYCLLLLDDFFPIKKINIQDLLNYQKEMVSSGASFLQISDITPSMLTKKPTKTKIVKTNKRYRLNLQPGIWKKEFLQKINFKEIITAWDFETWFINKENGQALNKTAIVLSSNERRYSFCNFIDKGLVSRRGQKLLLKAGLSAPQRKYQSRSQYLKLVTKTFISKILPSFIRRKIKKAYTKKGVKFYSND